MRDMKPRSAVHSLDVSIDIRFGIKWAKGGHFHCKINNANPQGSDDASGRDTAHRDFRLGRGRHFGLWQLTAIPGTIAQPWHVGIV
jgi:hypothetical protein